MSYNLSPSVLLKVMGHVTRVISVGLHEQASVGFKVLLLLNFSSSQCEDLVVALTGKVMDFL